MLAARRLLDAHLGGGVVGADLLLELVWDLLGGLGSGNVWHDGDEGRGGQEGGVAGELPAALLLVRAGGRAGEAKRMDRNASERE